MPARSSSAVRRCGCEAAAATRCGWGKRQPGDREIDPADAQGNVVRLYAGTTTLVLGRWETTIPVLRAPSFPYLEKTVAKLGGNVAGLLGLSSLGARVVIDDGVLRVDP
jgi:hypothetical protein